MTSWVRVLFNDETGKNAGLWEDGSVYGVKTLKTNDPNQALRSVFKSFADRGFFISGPSFDSVTLSYALADGTPQQKTVTRAELREKYLMPGVY